MPHGRENTREMVRRMVCGSMCMPAPRGTERIRERSS